MKLQHPMNPKNLIFMLLCLSNGVLSSAGNNGTTKPGTEACNIKDIGECGGSFIRFVAYDQEAIFGQNEQGNYRCFELQEKVDALNQEFDRRKAELRDRGHTLRQRYQDQEAVAQDPRLSAEMMKEQQALEIDAKVMSQEFQIRLGKIHEAFLRSVQQTVRELAEELDWEVVVPLDKKSSYVASKADVTEKIVKHLNNKYREQQRAKKDTATKKKPS